MYSPKIPERLIPGVYRMARLQRRPMTHLVAEALERYLEAEGSTERGVLSSAQAENGVAA